MVTTQGVLENNEILLDRTRFRVIGGLQSLMASVYPSKVVIGDTTRDSHPRASVLALSDWRAGIGIDKSEEAATVDRAWFSTFDLRHRNNLVLPRLATLTAAGASANVDILIPFKNEIYAFAGSSVRKYDNSGDSWGADLHTLPANATDAIAVRMQGTFTLFVAHTTGYSYTTDGSSWTDDTEDIEYFTWWDNKIFGIDRTGQLKWSTWGTPGDWNNDAQLPLDDDAVTDLFTGKDSSGNTIVYAMTTEGLFGHNFTDTVFEATELTQPLHPDQGTGTVRWRDSLYIPAGNAVFRYQDGTGTAVVSVVGPDRDDGLPSDKRGVIRQLLGSNNELIALLDSTSAPGSVDMFVSGESLVIDPDVGFSSILGWNELGWQVLWLGGESDQSITTGVVSNAYSEYRLWFGHNQRVYYIGLERDITNPDQLTDRAYAASATHETPWFNMGQDEVNKLAMHVDVNVSNITSTETLTISYAVNFSSTYTQLDQITTQPSDGHKHYHLPSGAFHEGVPFQWIRFKIDGARGGTTTLTPKLHTLELTYRKKLDLREGFQMELDLREDIDGLTPQQQRARLKEIMGSEKQVEFVYRCDTPDVDEIRRYFVDMISATNLEQTGLEERGTSRISLTEV